MSQNTNDQIIVSLPKITVHSNLDNHVENIVLILLPMFVENIIICGEYYMLLKILYWYCCRCLQRVLLFVESIIRFRISGHLSRYHTCDPPTTLATSQVCKSKKKKLSLSAFQNEIVPRWVSWMNTKDKFQPFGIKLCGYLQLYPVSRRCE